MDSSSDIIIPRVHQHPHHYGVVEEVLLCALQNQLLPVECN
jgi:hypothetical protein